MERNLVRERTSHAMRFKRDRGDRLGATPLGFRTPAPGAPMEPVPEELETVSLLLELRGRGLTFRAIAEELARRGLPTKRGGHWRASTVRRLWLGRVRYAALDAAV
jgi:DNA invertase Pin-like site-specific DNA recombinase